MTNGVVALADLGRRAADGEVVANRYGGYTAYGWTHMLVAPGAPRIVPLRLFLGCYTFKFFARREMDRWVRAWEHAEANGVNPCRR